jgi:stringent starvation protein B
MKDIRPYIINAHVQWLDDSNVRPHLVIENGPDVKVPAHLKSEPVISFLVQAGSVEKFILDETGVSFVARFNGMPFTVFAPLNNLVAIIAKNGEIQIPLRGETQKSVPIQEEQPTENVVPHENPPELKVLQGGAAGDGVPKAVLSIVGSS